MTVIDSGLELDAAGQPLYAPNRVAGGLFRTHILETGDMRAVLNVVMVVLQMYVWLLILAAVLSWLLAFNVVNPRNQAVSMVGEFLFRITEPVLRPIRNLLPSMGGIDISPVILILIIFLIQNIITLYIYPYVY
jgi:YggT family protein